MSSACKYRFGAFEACARTRQLSKHGVRLKLRPQPFQVLQILLERAGDVVTRDELRQILWSSETFVDFEHGLNTSIKELRGVLSDSASEPRYIETLPKLGYRLIVRVTKESAAEAAAAVGQTAPSFSPNPVSPQETGPEIAVAQQRPPQTIRRYGWLLAGAAFLLLVIGVGYWLRQRVRAQKPAGRLMLAVLPFENLTGDGQQEYFSDGLTEEMISQIGSLDPQHLGVIARTSAMHYKHTQEPLEQIGRELGVSYILEGSVRRDETRVRISAQLIQVKDKSHVWTRQYDRNLTELLSLQDEIGQEIANEIQLTLDGRTKAAKITRAASAETSYEAYDLYLRGLYFWNKRDLGFDQATKYFEQAIAKDPSYARAYAALASTYALIGAWSMGPPNEEMPKARAIALKALKLDDRLAEAHAALALVAERYDYDWSTTESEFHRAIQLDPDYATAHQWYGEYLSWQGRFDEALAESERARALDPMSLIIASDHVAILYRSRQYDRTIAEASGLVEMDPNFFQPYSFLVGSYIRKGEFARALDFVDRDLRPRNAAFGRLEEILIYGEWGRKADAERILKPSDACWTDGRCIESLVEAYMALGRKDEVMTLLQRLYSERSPLMTALKTEPVFDPLRSDPRFQDLLHRVHLDN